MQIKNASYIQYLILGVYLFAQNIILASTIVVLLLVANGTAAPVAAGITPIPMELLNTRMTDFFME
jgi:hypothetical protein